LSAGPDWRERCGRKIVSADAAVHCVRRGQRVFIGSGAAEPQALVAALARRGQELADTEIWHILTLGIAPYTEAASASAFRHNALFIGPNVRAAVDAGRADYTPIFLSEIPRLFRGGRVPIDVALIQVSPPDAHGFCSYGVSVDVVKAAAESAGHVIAEVNPRMPRTLGDSFIHLDQIDSLVENRAALPESTPPPPDPVAREIARYVARMIDSGATLQLGIGSIPHAVLHALGNRKDLGIHTEMFSDGVIDLIEAGAISGAKKTLLPGKVVASFCMGSERLYRYVDDNPGFEFRPVEFTNDPFTIAQNARMVAINGALEVDLTGQVCADSIGYNFYSGIGGQVDFVRGAARSEGGKPIIVIRSTARGGAVSRIVPHLQEGAGVVTTRGDVHYVVTEFGVADLWGKSVRDRALALISIAHPDFRAELLEAARRHHLVYEDQLLPLATRSPPEWEVEVGLRDGTRVRFRPARATDEPLLKELFYGCSDQSLYERYFTYLKAMPHSQLQHLANPDLAHEVVIVGELKEGERDRIVAIGGYVRDPATHLADLALLVHDAFQGRGLGTALLRHLIAVAQSQGVAGFTADVLSTNLRMLHVLHSSAKEVKSTTANGVCHLEFRFAAARAKAPSPGV
jgi:acyl-CoA hydrolase/GNAT superfamily N-acetyltransferase